MTRITEGYLLQNRKMHADDPTYGTAGGFCASWVSTIANRLNTRSILDYGCGKRYLQSSLDFWIQNYDPAIAGYDALPSNADILVCNDVLEHIEPQCLDAVLDHMVKLCDRAAFIVVNTKPSKKRLPDGRNRHLLLQEPKWWMEKLEKLFRLSRFFTTDNGCVFLGQSFRDINKFPDFADLGPPAEMTRITCKSVYTAEQRCNNIRSAMLRGFPSICQLPPHENTMVLACYGPSLKKTLPELTEDVRQGGDLYTVSGAHQLLLDRGFKPIGHVEADPRPIASTRFGKPASDVCYFLSSACSREMFEAVYGFETWLFHVDSFPEENELTAQMHPGRYLMSAGTDVGTTALALGFVLGYRKFRIHGMDCSFSVDSKFLNWPRDKNIPPTWRREVGFHAGPHPEEDQQVYRVWVGDRPFVTSPQMMQSAQDFLMMRGRMPKFKYVLRGDGFLTNVDKFLRRRKAIERREQLYAVEDFYRVRPQTGGSVHDTSKLDYQARLKARLYNSANNGNAAN